jgi:hypothetical protein
LRGCILRFRISQEYWKDLCVGDIVWIKKGQEVPADLVQLSSSDDKALDSLIFYFPASLLRNECHAIIRIMFFIVHAHLCQIHLLAPKLPNISLEIALSPQYVREDIL